MLRFNLNKGAIDVAKYAATRLSRTQDIQNPQDAVTS